MNRVAALVYGVVAYVAFLVAFLYAIGFVGNLLVPKSIDGEASSDTFTALLINVVLLGAFGVQHSVMARPAFKERWTKVVPHAIERSTFVLLSSLLLLLLYWQWRPIGGTVWDVQAQWLRSLVWALFFLGWGIVLYSSFLIDHFDLFGLRQVVLYLRGREYTPPTFARRSLYNWVRHPLMLGFLIAFWSAPTMTQGHLLFSSVTTVYILVAIQLEERDLARFLGEDYKQYQQQTSMLLPFAKRTRPPADDAA